MNISFSPPDITQSEIDEVVDTLKSGWITTGPKTKLFEKELAKYCNTSRAACLNSATAAMEMTLRLLGIGEGDEVITTAYTYTASASVIHHVGAKIVLIDTEKDSFHLDYGAIESKITSKTKAIIPVDIGGVMCDYDRIYKALENKKQIFNPSNDLQRKIGRVAVIADAAHSLGAKYKNYRSGEVADFTCFSLHAVKNLTTAEGGAVTWRDISEVDNEDIYKDFMLLSLHGQSKDALAKSKKGSWEYDIVAPNYKCNMTDIMASLGLAQIKRYPELLKRRKEIIERYDNGFKNENITVLSHSTKIYESSGHLYLIRLVNKSEEYRNYVIEKMSQAGIATNVHYKPLPMHTAYINLGFDIIDFPNAYNMYKNEITLPLNTLLNNDEVDYIIENMKNILRSEG